MFFYQGQPGQPSFGDEDDLPRAFYEDELFDCLTYQLKDIPLSETRLPRGYDREELIEFASSLVGKDAHNVSVRDILRLLRPRHYRPPEPDKRF